MNSPPSRLSLNDDLLEEDVDIPERSKSLSHAQTQIYDEFIKRHKCKHPKAFPDNSTVYLTEHQSMFGHGTSSSGNNLGPTQTGCDSKLRTHLYMLGRPYVGNAGSKTMTIFMAVPVRLAPLRNLRHRIVTLEAYWS